ncbi:hypothetical protein G5632_34545 [Escherichia coli]|nr:hypothetical protein [Escherichia coli]
MIWQGGLDCRDHPIAVAIANDDNPNIFASIDTGWRADAGLGEAFISVGEHVGTFVGDQIDLLR